MLSEGTIILLVMSTYATHNNINEQLKILEAVFDGKEIEYIRAITDSSDAWNVVNVPKDHLFDFSLYKYRIREKRIREKPLEASDLAPGCAIRWRGAEPGTWKAVVATYKNSVVFAGGKRTYEELTREGYEYSNDGGITWKPCWK